MTKNKIERNENFMIISSEIRVLLAVILVFGFMFFLNPILYDYVLTCNEEKEEIKEAIKKVDKNDIQKLKEKEKEIIRELRYAQTVFFLFNIVFISIFTITAIILTKEVVKLILA